MDMEQYLDMFIEESKEHLQAINENLLRLEGEPGNTGIVNDIFRSAHTLKGMSATMGFEDMANLTHEMENVLDQVRNGKLGVESSMMDTLFRCVDILESMVYSIAQGGDGRHDVTCVLQDLRSILSGEVVSSVPLATLTPGKEQASTTLFDDYEWTVIKQSIDSGFSAFQIETVVRENCVLKAARAYMVFDQLESSGDIVKAVPSVEELEEEKFDQQFLVVLITKKTKEELEKLVMSVSEIESVSIIEIDGQAAYTAEASMDITEPTEVSTPVEEDSRVRENVQADIAPAQKKVASGKTIRVDIERLDILMNLFSELVIDRGRLEQLSRDSKNPALIETVEHMSRISGDLQNIILNMRMVPVEQVFNRFPRMVRDLAKDLNKKVNLIIEGAETELDRTVIDEIGDPLVHLLRNSIDHGLESPEERAKLGKDEVGKVLLKAYHSGNHVFIEVMDNGKGIDRNKILKKAIEKGIIQDPQGMSDTQVYELLFASGLSTAEKITDVSGRGVGLDVVKTKIESLGGAVSVDSVPGQGTTFLIQLPLTLSIISAMLVEVEKEKFAVPLSSIIETAVFKKEQIMRAHQQDVIDFRGRVVPLVSLKKIFHIPGQIQEKKDEISVVIVRKGDKMAGLVVDSFIGQQEIVLKSLGKYLVNVFAISGATILGDGQVALIIDCNALIK